jgi:hypothetical protein
MNHRTTSHNHCGQNRGFYTGLFKRLIAKAAFGLDDHVLNCPRCQRRLGLLNRVESAIMLLQSEVHSSGLLAAANSKALRHLTHDLRFDPKAEDLRTVEPKPNWLEQKRPLIEKVMSVAACAAVMILFKTGLFSTIQKFQAESQDAMHHYYASRLDEKTADELMGPRQEIIAPETRRLT